MTHLLLLHNINIGGEYAGAASMQVTKLDQLLE